MNSKFGEINICGAVSTTTIATKKITPANVFRCIRMTGALCISTCSALQQEIVSVQKQTREKEKRIQKLADEQKRLAFDKWAAVISLTLYPP